MKKTTIIVIALIVIAVIFKLVVGFYKLQYQRGIENATAHDMELLRKALETNNATLCESTSEEAKCRVLVGQRHDDISACGSPELDYNNSDLSVPWCQIVVLHNETLCDELPKYSKPYCHDYYKTNAYDEVFNDEQA